MTETRSIVILTGAGISAESGISTFRGADGLWEKHRLEDVATPEGFLRNPDLVHRFYNERRRQLLSGTIQPNRAHLALAELEKRWPGDFLLVTQNIDHLHERAGNRKLLHMHGELLEIRCGNCGKILHWEQDLSTSVPCPECGRPGGLRPNVVWFGEMPMQMDRIYEALWKCDLFLAIGTSGVVYPAAGFVHEVRGAGKAHTVELNLEPSEVRSLFAERIYGPATKIVDEYVRALLKRT